MKVQEINRVNGMFPGRQHSFRYKRRPVGDYSLGRRGMAQDGGTTMGGTFNGEMDRCREVFHRVSPGFIRSRN